MEVEPKNKRYTEEDLNSCSTSRQRTRFHNRWSEFIEATTLHGIRYIFFRKRVWVRLLWLAFLLATAGFFLKSACGSVAKYYRYPFSTKVSNKFVSSLTFPAVSICPSNIVAKSKIYTNDYDNYFKAEGLNLSACSATEAIRAGYPCGHALLCCCITLPGEFMMGSNFVPNCSEKYKTQLQSALSYSSKSFNKREFLAKYSQSLKHMIGNNNCYFGHVLDKCNSTHFIQDVKDYGACYTFNSGKPGHPIRNAYTGGVSWGLTIILDLATHDHAMVNWAKGVRMVVHNQGEYFSILDGALVSPGTFASVAISRKLFINLRHPYKTECESRKLKKFPNYTQEGCQYECFADWVWQSCSCRVLSSSVNTNDRVCYSIHDDCVSKLWGILERGGYGCDCPTPCEVVKYSAEVSYADFPDPTTELILNHYGYSLDYARKNLVYLQIGYKSLSYEVYEQQSDYDIGSLFGEIGGNMGLFLGCSLLTICELLDFVAGVIFKWYQ